MKFLYLWPLVFILLVPVIIIVYLLKQKAQDKKVSSLYLWNEIYHNIEANTPWEKFKKNLLMFVQILTMLVLIVALMAPYIPNMVQNAQNIVVVIDNSASMNTIYDGEKTRFDVAVEQAVDYIKDLPDSGVVTVITSNDNAAILAGSTDKDMALNKLKHTECTNHGGSAEKGLEMARSLQIDDDSLYVICFTDTAVSMEGLKGYTVDMYNEAGNVSVDYLSHGYSSGNLMALCKISNYSENTMTEDVSLYGGDELLMVETVEIEAGKSEIVYFENINYDGNYLKAELNQKDALPADNVAYDVLSSGSDKKVLLVTDSNVYLEKALEMVDNITVTKATDVYGIEDFYGEKFDLYIFDSMFPTTYPEDGDIMIFGANSAATYSNLDYLGSVLVSLEEASATKYLDKMDFGAADVYGLNKPDWGETFLSVGDECVGFTGNDGTRNYAVWGFNIHNSVLPLKLEFPMMIYNIVTDFVASGILAENSIEVGDSLAINGYSDGENPTVLRPDGETSALSDVKMKYTSTDNIGVYTVSQNTKEGLVEECFAVNFPTSESRVINAPSVSDQGDLVQSRVRGNLDLRNIIIAICLLLLGVEWIIYLKK